MAHVILTDGRELDVADNDTGLLDYCRAEGAIITGLPEVVTFPVVVVNGERVDPPVTAAEGEYDPGEHNVEDVNTYLAGIDVDARERVLAIERDGKARVGITEGPHAPFDPSQHTVPEVNDYLAGEDVDDAERTRVLQLEYSGEARKGIVGDD